ncbi:MAG: hypothetical protein Q9208_007939 [Pyrenodesmia sp. 3 TL-2023]
MPRAQPIYLLRPDANMMKTQELPLTSPKKYQNHMDLDERRQNRHDPLKVGRRNPKLQARSILPNPYPMPDSPYSVDFVPVEERPPPPLPAEGVESAISEFLDQILDDIRVLGNEPVGRGYYEKIKPPRGHDFLLQSYPPPGGQGMTLNDTFNLLVTFRLKMRTDGYQERRADVYNNATGWMEGMGLFYAGDSQVLNKTLPLVPNSNPRLLSKSDLAIRFDHPGQSLPQSKVTESINFSRRRVLRYIELHGEGGFMPPKLSLNWKGVRIGIFLLPTGRRLTWSNILDVLAALMSFMEREGFRARVEPTSIQILNGPENDQSTTK